MIWFTGLSGSGKSTIARLVVEELERRGRPVEYLDGDTIRDIFPATGFTREERDQHIRRVGYLASRLERHGVTVIASLVSPYRASRDFVRGLCRDFAEIWIATPFEECERRDVKGLYAKARHGEIKNFTGLDDPYEPPVDAGADHPNHRTDSRRVCRGGNRVAGPAWPPGSQEAGRVPQLHENF